MEDLFKQLQDKHGDWLRGYRSLTTYIGNRDHSERELRTKLGQKYDRELVEDLVAYAHQNGWMAEPEEMAKRTAIRLIEKGKGKIYVQKYLAEKGLPQVDFDSEAELERAQKLAISKFGEIHEKSYPERQKIAQFLARRGFEAYICNSVALDS